ncbi:TAP-like protein-domain-containing protein [Xylariaceae sp. FL0016]|nr:TAP-like protein-domain-containing protein [Xylariaceae sp. FL0016]
MRFSGLVRLGALSAAAAHEPGDFNWGDIEPSRGLDFHDCYNHTEGESFRCARLLVPLDWLDETNPGTVALAIIKLPAGVNNTDPDFKGTIFTNPGGPGGSGVEFMLDRAHELQDIASGGNKLHEIISWDPRGVQFTTPNVDCFRGDYTARLASELQRSAIGPLDSSSNALRRQYAIAQGLGRLCNDSATQDPASILPYLTTPSVVRDMVHMVDMLAKSDDMHADAPTLVSSHVESSDGQQPLRMRDSSMTSADNPRINYWGFSYGTVLGQTFASMFPDRVGRMILDGVVDADDYMANGWSKNLQDTEDLVRFFYQSCVATGPERCALVFRSEDSWTDLKSRVDQLAKDLDEKPAHIVLGKDTYVVTGHEVVEAFHRPLYDRHFWPQLAETLSSALQGNYSGLLGTALHSQIPSFNEACKLSGNSSTAMKHTAKDAAVAILCADGFDSGTQDMSIGALEGYIQGLKAQSPTLGAFWSSIKFGCSGWTVRPSERFTGPFTSPAPPTLASATGSPADMGVQGGPAAPILFLSSRLDPVTPLRNAYRMSESYPGSVVLEQDSVGHCAIAEASRCTWDIIQEYFETGEVPYSGKLCKRECKDVWDTCEFESRGSPASKHAFEWGWI